MGASPWVVEQIKNVCKHTYTFEEFRDDFEYIYTYLGNGCNKPIAIKFIESGYDIDVLKQLIAERDSGTKYDEIK